MHKHSQMGHYGERKSLDDSTLCIKYILVTYNFVFFLFGLAILGIGLWIRLDRNFMSAIFGVELMSYASYLIMVGGALMIIFCLIGICGALYQNKALLLLHIIFTLIIFLTLMSGGVLALVFRSKVNETLILHMKESLQNDYGVNLENPYNRMVTHAWDKAQIYLYCCSVDNSGWATYKSSKWYTEQEGTETYDKPLVPLSCCTRDQYRSVRDALKCQLNREGPPYMTSGKNSALHMRGCFYEGREFIKEYSRYLAGIGLGIGLLLLFGLVLSLLLFFQLQS